MVIRPYGRAGTIVMSSGVAGEPHHVISLEPRLFAPGLLQLLFGLPTARHVLAVGDSPTRSDLFAVYVLCCYCLLLLL